MRRMQTELFSYSFQADCDVDIGRSRSSNQDEIIFCPEYGFFAVSDGMGGLPGGGETSALIKKTLPGFIAAACEDLRKDPRPELAAELLIEQLCLLSNNIYERLNQEGGIHYGATLCGVWLVGSHVVFINLGDSRGYKLGFYKKRMNQITRDHNVAALLLAAQERGEETETIEQASSMLTRFVGMKSPALPETFVTACRPGDRILLCSDGLYGMVADTVLAKTLRSSSSPRRVVENLIEAANRAGGRDNISAAYLKIG